MEDPAPYPKDQSSEEEEKVRSHEEWINGMTAAGLEPIVRKRREQKSED